ncbi:MAG: hypothetical protein ACR2M1_08760 [Gemmatimonadaceae bacterium]
MAWPVFPAASRDALGPVMAVGESGEHAATAANAEMLSNVRAWSDMWTSPVIMVPLSFRCWALSGKRVDAVFSRYSGEPLSGGANLAP